MAAYELRKLLLYMPSILWDLNVPQEAASRLYEDNNACMAMANIQKPTSCTRHMDIRYHVLCEWVEWDLIVLERVDTMINKADHFTKLISWVLFNRHIDYIMGHVPPEYSPAHDRFVGQFDAPAVQLTPDSYMTKDTLSNVTTDKPDDAHITVTAKAAHIYTPDYSAFSNNYWIKIGASTSFPSIQYSILQHQIVGGVLEYIGLST